MSEHGTGFPESFHSASVAWFRDTLGDPTRVQVRGWAAVATGAHTLISAPTGSGKTLAAFLEAIDELVREAAAGPLPDRTRIVYVSPLKALGNDVDKNLAGPLRGIAARAETADTPIRITTAVRTGDTTAAERARMVRRPPHLLVTTPEGLYALLTSAGGRAMLSEVRTVIIDEIHALASDRRGAHLALSLERLDALVTANGGRPVQRIGLSATQSPIEDVAAFLAGAGRQCTIIDEGHVQQRDLRIELPGTPLAAVMSIAGWDVLVERIADIVRGHRTTLVFVNSRRQSERVAHLLAQKLGADVVASHHGSLAPALRLDAEARLKDGKLRVLVATASLELGLDIGDVDLVIQLGAVKRIATLLQRVGRANHRAGGVPTGRIVPLTRDDLVECVALLHAATDGALDRLVIPAHPLDVLAQQVVAACAVDAWRVDDLFALVTRAWPYRDLFRADFDRTLAMLAEGFPTERGRRGQLLAVDTVNRLVSARRGASLIALSSGGTIPDSGDYAVRLEPDGVVVGAVAEDFAIHQLPGHVIQLGSNSWRVLRVAAGEVRVERAPGEAPYMPVWFGEQPPRSDELTAAVSSLRQQVSEAPTEAIAVAELLRVPGMTSEAAEVLVKYLRATDEALGVTPSCSVLVAERFRDDAGGSQLVLHAPVGVRITRAWALALRHVLMTRFNVELQATATDDGLLLSLPGTVSFPLGDVFSLVSSEAARLILARAVREVPMFMVRWRWAASRALLVPRMRGGRRVPPHLQRTDADELLLVALGDDAARRAVGRSLRVEAEAGSATSMREDAATTDPQRVEPVPEQPLLRQALHDCLHEAMDADGLIALLDAVQRGGITVRSVERIAPSPAAYALVTARPPAFLDNGALMDRRTRNVRAPSSPGLDTAAPLNSLRHSDLVDDLAVHPEAVTRIRREVAPDFSSLEDAAAQLQLAGVIAEGEIVGNAEARVSLDALVATERAFRFLSEAGTPLWGAVERCADLVALFPDARRELGTRAPSASPNDPIAVLARFLAGRLESSGPVTVGDVVDALTLPATLVEAALERLIDDGRVLRGSYDPVRPDATTWCDRRVLSRIERLTRNRLRAEIEAVPVSTYWRFLLRWQGVTAATRRRGRDGVASVLAMLDGIELPATVWEASVLPARIAGYDLDLLDDVCLSGKFGWGRLSLACGVSEGDVTPRTQLTKATPLALFRAEHLETWRAFAASDTSAAGGELSSLSGAARRVVERLVRRGPSFLQALERALESPAGTVDVPGAASVELELALLELVGAGWLTADAFAAVRGLLARPAKWGVPRLVRLANLNTGRWSLLPPPEPLSDPVARDRAVERYARTLLQRYGVVVRPVVQRESAPAAGVRWGELLRMLRRLEARGEIRGGYFVQGAGGEHFALPEAVALLREVSLEAPAGELIALSTADPLNLTGILDDGPRVASRTTGRVLLEGGEAVAALEGRRVISLRAGTVVSPAHESVLRADLAPAALAAFT